MSLVITILIIIASALLILVVLVQNSKGGGLDSSFGNTNQLGGAAQSTETIEKATWTLAGGIAALSIIAAMFIGAPGATDIDTQIKGQTPNIGVPVNTPPATPPPGQ